MSIATQPRPADAPANAAAATDPGTLPIGIVTPADLCWHYRRLLRARRAIDALDAFARVLSITERGLEPSGAALSSMCDYARGHCRGLAPLLDAFLAAPTPEALDALRLRVGALRTTLAIRSDALDAEIRRAEVAIGVYRDDDEGARP